MKYFIRGNFFVLVLLVLVSSKVFSAVPIVYYSTEKFPAVNVKFMLVDNTNRVVTNLNQVEAGINFLDNNVPMTSMSFATSVPPIDKASIVIAFDLSISGRTSNPAEFGYAIDITNNFISYLDPAQCEVSLISISSIPSIESDFTNSMSDISVLLNGFSPRSFGNLYRGIRLANTGALAVLENETTTNKSILLVTQGIISLDETAFIIENAKQNGVRINVLYICNTIPTNIRRIAEETGGYCVSKEMMDKIGLPVFSTMAKLSEGYTPYNLTANGIVNCDGKHTFKLNTNYGSNDFSIDIDNVLLTKIEAKPPSLEFPFVKPTITKTDSVYIYARNTGININAIYTDNPLFKIENLPQLPNYLSKDDSLKLKISFTPVDSCISFSRLIIKSDACQYDTLFMTGGYPNVAPRTPTIKIVKPKCNDVLVIGDTIEIEWNGVLPTDVVSLFSEKFTSITDTIAKNIVGLKHKYFVKDNGKEESIRFFIKQNWPNNIGKTLDFKHNAPVLSAFWNNYQDKIVTTDNDNYLTIWNANTATKIHTFPKFNKEIRHAKYAPTSSTSDTYIGVTSYDSCAYILDANNFSTYWKYITNADKVQAIEFSPDGKYAVIALENGNFEVLDIEKKVSILKKNIGKDENCKFATFHPTKQEIMAISWYTGIIRFYDFEGNFLDSIDARNGWQWITTEYGGYNHDGSQIVYLNYMTHTADVIDRASGEIEYSITHEDVGSTDERLINYASFFYNDTGAGLSNCILTSGDDYILRRWNILDGTETDTDHAFIEHKGKINTGMFSNDGWRMLSSSDDSTAKIWNLNQKTLQSDTTCMFRIAYARGNTKDVLDLGNAFVSEIIIKTFNSVYTNICDFNYNIKAIRIVGDNPADFIIDGINDFKFPMNINEAGMIDFNIAFRPTEIGMRKAKIQIIIPNDTLYIDLIGVGLNIGLLPLCELIDFGNVFIDDYKDTLLPIAVNISDAIITITNIDLAGPQKANFKFITDNTGVKLNPNDTLFAEIRFFPLTLGRKNAVLNIKHTFHSYPLSFNLMGKGVPLANDTIQLTINNFTGEIGQIINCPITMKTLTHNNLADLTEIVFSIVYNSTLIYPMSYSNEVKISNPNLFDNGYSSTDIAIPYKPGQQRIDGLQFVGLLGNDITTDIQIINTKSISHSRYYVNGNTATFNLVNNCNAGGTRLFDEKGKLVLNPNIPNPASNETKIEFELLENGFASLDIYDISGKHIMNVFAEDKQKGSYSITLNTKQLTSGMYYYILYNARQQKIQTMLVE